jgi:deazaflavin-dependent oxidoreductase (nitroreductase family)
VEANPDVTIEIGTETISVKARALREGPERDELFARQVALYPQFGEYAEKTKEHRTIPVVVLERAS